MLHLDVTSPCRIREVLPAPKFVRFLGFLPLRKRNEMESLELPIIRLVMSTQIQTSVFAAVSSGWFACRAVDSAGLLSCWSRLNCRVQRRVTRTVGGRVWAASAAQRLRRRQVRGAGGTARPRYCGR